MALEITLFRPDVTYTKSKISPAKILAGDKSHTTTFDFLHRRLAP